MTTAPGALRASLLLFAVGCATPMSALRDDNRRLNQKVVELRTDRRAQDRKLRDLQHQLDALRASAVTGAGVGAGAGAMAPLPPLPVEVAAPPASSAIGAASDGARVVGVTEDGTEIVYEGDAALGRPAPAPVALIGGAGDAGPAPGPRRATRAPAPLPLEVPVAADRIEVTRRIPPIAARAALRKPRDHEPPSERGGDAANDYRVAVDLVKAGKHGEAIAALRAFVARYPRHDYADNAQYWIGEAFYAQHDYAPALSEFRKVIEVYPRGNKIPDALLKVGYCHQAMGQGEKARAVLEQVVNFYPRSEPAVLAAKRLETP